MIYSIVISRALVSFTSGVFQAVQIAYNIFSGSNVDSSKCPFLHKLNFLGNNHYQGYNLLQHLFLNLLPSSKRFLPNILPCIPNLWFHVACSWIQLLWQLYLIFCFQYNIVSVISISQKLNGTCTIVQKWSWKQKKSPKHA